MAEKHVDPSLGLKAEGSQCGNFDCTAFRAVGSLPRVGAFFLRIIIVRHDISLQQVFLVEELVPDDFGIWQIYLSIVIYLTYTINIYMHTYIILCIL